MDRKAMLRPRRCWSCRYGLSVEQIAEAETMLEEMAATAQTADGGGSLALVDIMGEPPTFNVQIRCPIR